VFLPALLILFRSPQVHKIEDFGDGGIGKATRTAGVLKLKEAFAPAPDLNNREGI
jgi:hypothetical protein